MTARNKLNLWMAEDTGERDALTTDGGLQLGDFCMVDGVNLYVCETLSGNLGVWRPLAGVPTFGRYGVGGRNLGGAAAGLFTRTACTFSAVLDGLPTSISLVPDAVANWATTPTATVINEFGFDLYGFSDVVGPGLDAWNIGNYMINY